MSELMAVAKRKLSTDVPTTPCNVEIPSELSKALDKFLVWPGLGRPKRHIVAAAIQHFMDLDDERVNQALQRLMQTYYGAERRSEPSAGQSSPRDSSSTASRSRSESRRAG